MVCGNYGTCSRVEMDIQIGGIIYTFLYLLVIYIFL